MIGTYISTVSGYEHHRMVLRRLNQALSRESQQDELHAIFAFRAHTPEGHAVEQMGLIADVLFSTSYRCVLRMCLLLHAFVCIHPRHMPWSSKASLRMSCFLPVMGVFCVCASCAYIGVHVLLRTCHRADGPSCACRWAFLCMQMAFLCMQMAFLCMLY
jgi:hypothetical protein